MIVSGKHLARSSNTPVKVGVIAPVDWEVGRPIGGTSRVIYTLLPYLPIEIHLLGMSIKNQTSRKAGLDIDKSRIHALFKVSYPSRLPLRVKAFLGYWISKRKIAKLGLDLLYVHSSELAIPFLLGKHLAPVVFHQHGASNPLQRSDFHWARWKPLLRTFDFILRFVHQNAHAIIAIDKVCYDQSIANGAEARVHLISNPVDITRFKVDPLLREATRKSFGFRNEDAVILFAGRLSSGKGIIQIVEAIRESRSHGLSWSLVIAGEGALGNHIRKYVSNIGVEESVMFLGTVSYEEMPSLYSMADVVALPSYNEGVPMVLLEALACGTPVTATNVGGIPEILQSGRNGILLPDRSVDSLCDGLQKCLSLPWGREKISNSVAPWSAQVKAREILNVFSGVLSGI